MLNGKIYIALKQQEIRAQLKTVRGRAAVLHQKGGDSSGLEKALSLRCSRCSLELMSFEYQTQNREVLAFIHLSS